MAKFALAWGTLSVRSRRLNHNPSFLGNGMHIISVYIYILHIYIYSYVYTCIYIPLYLRVSLHLITPQKTMNMGTIFEALRRSLPEARGLGLNTPDLKIRLKEGKKHQGDPNLDTKSMSNNGRLGSD